MVDKKLQSKLQTLEKNYNNASRWRNERNEVLALESAGVLQTESELEKTYKVTQEDIRDQANLSIRENQFDLSLDFGPYKASYDQSGSRLLISGQSGHVASFDWRRKIESCELHLRQNVRDAIFLHSSSYFAVAQARHVYIYDGAGVELHRLSEHVDPLALEFLQYHFLLASIGNPGWLKWTDTSTGSLVASHGTHLGSCSVMTQNKQNAVLHLGHSNGCVTMWSPNVPTPLVKWFTHPAPLTACAIDRSGNYLATAARDCTVRVWDVRMFKGVYHYTTKTPVNNLSISDTGLLGIAWGPHVTVWNNIKRKQASPYMNHLQSGSVINSISFTPFEDLMAIGHAKGISSIVIPGSGEPNYDSLEANPYATTKQKQEMEVQRLLDKIPADTISLDPNFIGTVRDKKITELEIANTVDENIKSQLKTTTLRKRMRGKNSTLRKMIRRRAKHIIDERSVKLARARELEKEKRHDNHVQKSKQTESIALSRFRQGK